MRISYSWASDWPFKVCQVEGAAQRGQEKGPGTPGNDFLDLYPLRM